MNGCDREMEGLKGYAAGILPYALYENEIVFLIGQDAHDGLWSDFGGKFEPADRTALETAQREFNEETCGAVIEAWALKVRMSLPRNYHMLTSATQSRHPYFMFVVELPFDSGCRACFKRITSFLRSERIQKRYVEKMDVQWVTWKQLCQMNLRRVFHATIIRHQRYLRDLGRPPDVSET